jgi:hypothetical protein
VKGVLQMAVNECDAGLKVCRIAPESFVINDYLWVSL